jgi:drug/metabolite transporter (DMT)-like permease
VALGTGPVALVQPIFIIELPFTLLVASRVARRKFPRRTWWAVGLVTVSLGAGLAAAAPSGGSDHAPLRTWVMTLIVTAVFEAVVITVGVRAHGNARGAAFGLAAACGYALTATLMKSAVTELSRGIVPFFTAWQLYATAVAGVGALFLLQNALQAGSLVAVQPPLTLGDALISASYGVTVYGEEVQSDGWLLVAEIAALIAIVIGCIELSRSLAVVHETPPPGLPGALEDRLLSRRTPARPRRAVSPDLTYCPLLRPGNRRAGRLTPEAADQAGQVLGVAAAELLRLRVEAGQFAGDVGQDGGRGRGGEEREGGETGVQAGCELAGLLTAPEFGGDPSHQPGPAGGGGIAG